MLERYCSRLAAKDETSGMPVNDCSMVPVEQLYACGLITNVGFLLVVFAERCHRPLGAAVLIRQPPFDSCKGQAFPDLAEITWRQGRRSVEELHDAPLSLGDTTAVQQWLAVTSL